MGGMKVRESGPIYIREVEISAENGRQSVGGGEVGKVIKTGREMVEKRSGATVDSVEHEWRVIRGLDSNRERLTERGKGSRGYERGG